jgi:hypothetical protein
MKVLHLMQVLTSFRSVASFRSGPSSTSRLQSRQTAIQATGGSSDQLKQRLAAGVAALALLATPWAPDAACANDFGGLPPSTASSALGLKRNGVTAAPSESGLGLFVDKDGPSLLRLALPDADVRAREVQANLELVKLRLDQVGFSGKTPIWNAAAADASRAEGGLNKHFDEFVSEVAPNQQVTQKCYT